MKIWTFDSTGDAYDEIQWTDHIRQHVTEPGDVLIAFGLFCGALVLICYAATRGDR